MSPLVVWSVLAAIGMLLAAGILVVVTRRAILAHSSGQNGDLHLMAITFLSSSGFSLVVLLCISILAILGFISPEREEWTTGRAIIIIIESLLILFLLVQAYAIWQFSYNKGRELEHAEDRKRIDMVSEKLDAIHILVNSNLTISIQKGRDASVRELISLRELIALKQKLLGEEPSPETLAELKSAQEAIDKSDAELHDRLVVQQEMEKK